MIEVPLCVLQNRCIPSEENITEQKNGSTNDDNEIKCLLEVHCIYNNFAIDWCFLSS